MKETNEKSYEGGPVGVRCSDGEFIYFPLVDNKKLFPTHFKTNEDFSYQLSSALKFRTHALYKRHKNIAYLVCAWVGKDEINEAALKIIKADKTLHYLLNKD